MASDGMAGSSPRRMPWVKNRSFTHISGTHCKVSSCWRRAKLTPVRHIHPVETYGLLFHAGEHTFSYIADTRYFDALWQSYGGELIILNVVLLDARPGVDHLTVADAAHIIEEVKPKVAILNHYGMGVWRARPWEVAERLSQETGIRVIAARDGMKFDLSRLEVIKIRREA